MTTPNGQHQIDPNGSAQQATSTVLALDGWGPVIAEPPANGANGSNGSEPEAIAEAAPVVETHAPRADWRESIRSSWRRDATGPVIDPQLIRLLAPLAAMTIAVFAALKLGGAYRTYQATQIPEPTPTPPNRIAILRRSIALAIDPSLTPVEPPRPVWQRWLG